MGWAGTMAFLMFALLKYTVGLTLNIEDQRRGDAAKHGVAAYPYFGALRQDSILEGVTTQKVPHAADHLTEHNNHTTPNNTSSSTENTTTTTTTAAAVTTITVATTAATNPARQSGRGLALSHSTTSQNLPFLSSSYDATQQQQQQQQISPRVISVSNKKYQVHPMPVAEQQQQQIKVEELA